MKGIICLNILVLITGCSDFAIHENITGHYYIIAGDVEEDAFISYHETDDGSNYGGIIEPTVFGVGYNKEYMIVEQHPRVFLGPPNRSVTNYYILPLLDGMNWKNNNGLMGPLTLEQFDQKRKELNIPQSLTFSKVFKNLE